MWPDEKQQLDDKSLNALYTAFNEQLNAFVHAEKLDDDFKLTCKDIYLPLAKWIESRHSQQPVIIGINGAQGSGKSTLARLLLILLETLFNKRVLHLSIDDLYLSKSARLSLATDIHPLLETRGVPGTHNVDLGIQILEAVKQSSMNNIHLPVFDKSIDDLISEDKWPVVSESVDIVLFEGWCVAAHAQSSCELIKPLNKLESIQDKEGHWREYVNEQLAGPYQKLFSKIDFLIMLKVPDMNSVFEWRCLQETKLKERSKQNNQTMSDDEIEKFIMYFERITLQCLKDMPERADVLLALDRTHQVVEVKVK